MMHKHTPLFEKHEALNGRMVDFGGWELPIQYSGILEEHETVRRAAGLFDVSHMGEIEIRGAGATQFVQRLVTGDVEKQSDRQLLYALMCNEDGGTVDDLIVYRHDENRYLLVVNACNTEKDFDWITGYAPKDLAVENRSDSMAQLAVQGPSAQRVLQALTDYPLDTLSFFHFVVDMPIVGCRALVSRSGYTGEDGFEIYLPSEDAPAVWDAIIQSGAPFGLLPIGLGARDTLRFEACLPLYGHELSDTITPLEANLGMFVKLDKGDFIGREALIKQKEEGVPRERIGISMVDRGIPRSGYEVHSEGQPIGTVTSGSFAPTLKRNLGMALVERGAVEPDGACTVAVRGRQLSAKRVPMPFYKKRYRK